MDQFEKALACKTLAPLRHELFEKGKKAEVGEVREWKGQKVRKTANGWVPVTDGKQKSNQEETSTETKEQPQDLATLARSASDSALKVAAQGPNEEVRIAAKRELERRKSEGSDVFEAPKGEDFSTEGKHKVTSEREKSGQLSETSKTNSNKKLSSKDPSSREGVEEFLKANFFTSALSISSRKFGLEYTITENPETGKLVVSSNRAIRCEKNVTSLNNNGAFEWGNIEDIFDCSDCTSLTSLTGAPKEVKGIFDCSGCTSLTSLEGAPKAVRDIFDCSGCTKLTSLTGAPEKVGGYFDCSSCTSLTSFTGAPKEVGGDFFCKNVGKTFKPSEIRKICNVSGRVWLK